MRRILAILGIAALTGTTPVAAQDLGDRASCEWFCFSMTASCYATLSVIVGREMCEMLYEGCIAGCYASFQDDG